jgi:hypothetical protein
VSGSYTSVSVHLGEGTRITCHTYSSSAPILSVDAGELHLTVHGHGHRAVDAVDVANAQALAEAVAVYLAECERVYRMTSPDIDRPTVRGDAADAAADVGEESAA